MKIWHISDTHTYHGLLDIPENIDIVIHSGDATNPKDPYLSEDEMQNFIYWYSLLPIKHKVFVAGNHDVCIERNFIKKDDFDCPNHYAKLAYNLGQIKAYEFIMSMLPDTAKR